MEKDRCDPSSYFFPDSSPVEKDGKPVKVSEDHPGFHNWGGTVSGVVCATSTDIFPQTQKLAKIFYPETIVGAQNCVKYVKSQGARLRCGGFRHTWSPMWPQNNGFFLYLDLMNDELEYLISMIPEDVALPYGLKHILKPWGEYNADPNSLLQVLYRTLIAP